MKKVLEQDGKEGRLDDRMKSKEWVRDYESAAVTEEKGERGKLDELGGKGM